MCFGDFGKGLAAFEERLVSVGPVVRLALGSRRVAGAYASILSHLIG